jgi:hypothetical protein
VRVRVACSPGSPAVPNEDAYATSLRAVAVVDGTTSPPGMGTGCLHGTAWFARSLAADLAAVASAVPERSLQTVLEHSLAQIASRHSTTCDLTTPGSPSAAVGVLRERADQVDYLVLSDVTILIQTGLGARTITDDRCSALLGALPGLVMSLPGGSPERERQLARLVATQRELRNVPGGYWLAGAVPEAARRAITGSADRHEILGAALLTDGAARLVDLFGTASWTSAVDTLRRRGPRAWIEQTRCLEAKDPDMTCWPRLKPSDDATVAVVTFRR